uniref:Cyclin C-terminal domain-containing protein n=1 Tax=Grammatophora oceanica TaxID=210454 RepID=A0A7S1VBR8_9STRA|mmetsp:Transcript_42243/g.62572  ORF Transcript_42243/g.62572 Transcript_42243/m.62572 type:complete len:153 (+) Transcript_42243:1-459(+)
MNPPTMESFVRTILSRCELTGITDEGVMMRRDILPQHVKQHILKLSKEQLEASRQDYSFIQVRPSKLAAAAVSNSLRSLGTEFSFSLGATVDPMVAAMLAPSLPSSATLPSPCASFDSSKQGGVMHYESKHGEGESTGHPSSSPKCVSGCHR